MDELARQNAEQRELLDQMAESWGVETVRNREETVAVILKAADMTAETIRAEVRVERETRERIGRVERETQDKVAAGNAQRGAGEREEGRSSGLASTPTKPTPPGLLIGIADLFKPLDGVSMPHEPRRYPPGLD